MSIDPCPRCDGNGHVLTGVHQDPDTGLWDTEDERCRACHGTGRHRPAPARAPLPVADVSMFAPGAEGTPEWRRANKLAAGTATSALPPGAVGRRTRSVPAASTMDGRAA